MLQSHISKIQNKSIQICCVSHAKNYHEAVILQTFTHASYYYSVDLPEGLEYKAQINKMAMNKKHVIAHNRSLDLCYKMRLF